MRLTWPSIPCSERLSHVKARYEAEAQSDVLFLSNDHSQASHSTMTIRTFHFPNYLSCNMLGLRASLSVYTGCWLTSLTCTLRAAAWRQSRALCLRGEGCGGSGAGCSPRTWEGTVPMSAGGRGCAEKRTPARKCQAPVTFTSWDEPVRPQIPNNPCSGRRRRLTPSQRVRPFSFMKMSSWAWPISSIFKLYT